MSLRLHRTLGKGFEKKLKTGEPLSRHTTFGVGGRADYFFEADSLDSLREILLFCKKKDIKWTLLGGGSNLLACDEGYAGCVIKLVGDFSEISRTPAGLRAGGGARLARLVKESCRQGLSGLECLAGIPGTVGGALVMNAGGRYGAIGDCICRAGCFSEEAEELDFPKKQIRFGYRSSNLSDFIITWAEFELKRGDAGEIKGRVGKIVEEKARTQPLGQKSAGCIFKNPGAGSAGELIERAHLKGRRAGGAYVSRVHANYIINDGSATAADIFALIDAIRSKVREKFGVELELEIKVIG